MLVGTTEQIRWYCKQLLQNDTWKGFLAFFTQVRKSIITSSWTGAGNLPSHGTTDLSIGAGLTRLTAGVHSGVHKHWPTYRCLTLRASLLNRPAEASSHLLEWASVAVSNKYLIIAEHSTSPQTSITPQVPWLQHNTQQQSHGTTGTTAALYRHCMLCLPSRGSSVLWEGVALANMIIHGSSHNRDLSCSWFTTISLSAWKQRSDCDSDTSWPYSKGWW